MKNDAICYIIGAAPCKAPSITVRQQDMLICADGGYETAVKASLFPSLAVGDFDSLGYVPDGNVVVHPSVKDDTDSMLAVDCGFKAGYSRFELYGMLGGRLDHSYANLQLLAYIHSRGGTARLVGDEYTVFYLKNSSVELEKRSGGYISVFSFSPKSTGVNISGLKYEVENFELSSNLPMAVSNEYVGKRAKIEVKSGELLIMSENAC